MTENLISYLHAVTENLRYIFSKYLSDTFIFFLLIYAKLSYDFCSIKLNLFDIWAILIHSSLSHMSDSRTCSHRYSGTCMLGWSSETSDIGLKWNKNCK